jgi:hypothetical protein
MVVCPPCLGDEVKLQVLSITMHPTASELRAYFMTEAERLRSQAERCEQLAREAKDKQRPIFDVCARSASPPKAPKPDQDQADRTTEALFWASTVRRCPAGSISPASHGPA